MGTKNDPGKLDCFNKADPDEPIFTLRAKDPLAPTVVRIWAELHELVNVGDTLQASCDEKVHEALQVSQAMRYWKKHHD